MIYKSDFDGQWHKINPDYAKWDEHLNNSMRRMTFDLGIFRVNKDRDQYHLFVKDWSIGAWYPGDSKRARLIIDSAFNTYYTR